MGIPHSQRIWQLHQAVVRKDKIASPKRMGGLHFKYQQYRRIIPTLMHGERITFGFQVSEKGKNKYKRAWFPHVVFMKLYSQALDMTVYTRLSSKAHEQMELAGGFDEYMLTVDSDKWIECDIAKMFQKRIKEAYAKSLLSTTDQKQEGVLDSLQLLKETYGDAYYDQIQATYIDNLKDSLKESNSSNGI